MYTASATLKQIIEHQDVDTWGLLSIRDLPVELRPLYKIISKHFDNCHKLPTFEELRYEVRDAAVREKLYSVEAIEVDVPADLLYKYLKNERVQNTAFDLIGTYVNESLSFEDAEETVQSLYDLARQLEVEAELEHPTESMQRIDLFESDLELSKYLPLGLNEEFDSEIRYTPRDLIMFGGKRGEGKSVVCSNISNNVVEQGRSSLYFTIEMHTRQVLQRNCAIATGVPLTRLKLKTLSMDEWLKVVKWWADRFNDAEEVYQDYKKHHSFDKFHRDLIQSKRLKEERRLDIVYDPELTISKIQAEVDKRAGQDFGVICVDYMNEVKLSRTSADQYDWKDQITISKKLKTIAQDYEIPVVTPYQIADDGRARFSKAILNAADAAYIINANSHEDRCMEFNCTKMRNGPQRSFASVVDWDTLKIGPENGSIETDEEIRTEESAEDVPF